MGSSRPSWHYVSASNRWELRGKSGKLRLAVNDNDFMYGKVIVGSNAAIDVGTDPGVASIPVIGVLSGDIVIANPIGSLSPGLSISPARVTGTNNINVYVVNTDDATTASLPAMGWDVHVIKPK